MKKRTSYGVSFASFPLAPREFFAPIDGHDRPPQSALMLHEFLQLTAR
jgi:hypothetical protein